MTLYTLRQYALKANRTYVFYVMDLLHSLNVLLGISKKLNACVYFHKPYNFVYKMYN